MSRPQVTAVVLNWSAEEESAACLRSLFAGDYAPLRVLLVDNASPDGSGARLRARFPEAVYLQTEENLGYTGGNNRGIERALALGADYVLILNNDTVVAADCVSRLVEAAQADPKAGAVGAKILFYDAPDRIWFGGGALRRLRVAGVHLREGENDGGSAPTRPEVVSFLTGCCLLVPAPVLRRVGGFEEDFFAYVEDVEFSLRLGAAGYRLLYQPAARVLHRVSLEPRAPSPFQIVQRDRNRRRLARRRFGALQRLGFAAFFYPTRALRLADYLLRGDRERAAAVWRGMTAP